MAIGMSVKNTFLQQFVENSIRGRSVILNDTGASEWEGPLEVTVIRLLAIALNVAVQNSQALGGASPVVPPDYRSWPVLSSQLTDGKRHRGVWFYLNLKAASTLGSQRFPVGSTFVVETFRPGPESGGALLSPSAARGDFLFIMTKCASVLNSGTSVNDAEVWLHAHYDGEGNPLGAGWSLCRLCSVAVDSGGFSGT
jgi:hypothetical protein